MQLHLWVKFKPQPPNHMVCTMELIHWIIPMYWNQMGILDWVIDWSFLMCFKFKENPTTAIDIYVEEAKKTMLAFKWFKC